MVDHFWLATWAVRSLFCFFQKNSIKTVKNVQKIQFYSNYFEQIAYFLWAKEKNDRFAKKTEWFAHSLFCAEQPVQITHICSFVMSNLSDLLTVAPLSWATWANHSHSLICIDIFERKSKWVMCEWANSQPCHGPW